MRCSQTYPYIVCSIQPSRANPFPNPVASGMDDGVFDVHTRLFVNEMSSPFEDDNPDDPIAVKESEPVPPPVKLMIPQLSFGPVGGNKDSPTAKSMSMLPAVGPVRTPDKISSSKWRCCPFAMLATWIER